ncbi:MAG TPA: hypothetical protein VLC91_10560 [Spongiibacteraceae bacterium]|nr:hypothetical protein [Spongiibacteraceae bacterium]
MTAAPMRSASLPVAIDHPVFAGHFPGAPIVPGVLLIDWALAAIEAAENIDLMPGELNVVKFLQPVAPGADLLLRYTVAGNTDGAAPKITFRIECGAHLMASGSATALPLSTMTDSDQ